ncbi:MAG: class I SAM-dependent methyltransferase [Leptospira sp.]|nr:class I SAM-dependent methyltransferase [Leptospira sp.]
MNLFDFVPHPVFPETYHICKQTGILKYLLAENRVYGESYFMEEYQAQYKKTYYEDEKNLRSMAVRRLGVIQDFFNSTLVNKSLLEIGSAAGFFLDEAKKLGFQTKGYELSANEVEYSKNKLKLDVEKKSILDITTSTYTNSFDVIAAFFVVEHISEIEALWERFGTWLKTGGVIYLAVPSFFGPTFKTNPNEWFRTHPKDHFYDYDLGSLKKLLSNLGFHLRYARPMSYHPKRDLGLRGSLPDWAYRFYSNLTCYGDTIEVAFQKK